MLGGNFVNRFNIAGRSYKVIPQISRVDRLNPEQLLNIYITGPAGELLPLGSVATIENTTTARSLNRFQQLNAVKISGVAVRPLDEALKFLESEAAAILPKGLRSGLHGGISPAQDRGQQVHPGVRPRRHPHIPGAGGPVQQLPGPLRHPRRLGSPGPCSAPLSSRS